MLIQSVKLNSIVLIIPLVISFLANDCAHQKRNVMGQSSGPQNNVKQNKMGSARTGTWGGEHIRLEVTAQGAEVEYDCAHGTIDQPIVPDAEGRFQVLGTNVREHGGPVRKDETEDSHPAQFNGQIKGETMTLTVKENDTKEVLGTYSLVYGQQPRLMKCR